WIYGLRRTCSVRVIEFDSTCRAATSHASTATRIPAAQSPTRVCRMYCKPRTVSTTSVRTRRTWCCRSSIAAENVDFELMLRRWLGRSERARENQAPVRRTRLPTNDHDALGNERRGWRWCRSNCHTARCRRRLGGFHFDPYVGHLLAI